MAVIKVRGYEIDLDIKEEVIDYEWGDRASWTEDKLIASSPFRQDSKPSFYLNLEGEYAGNWGDSGAIIETERYGRLPRLLAYLRGETEEQSEEYLLDKYGVLYEDHTDIRLPEIAPKKRIRNTVLSENIITTAISPYLRRRGISDDIQIEYRTGYNPEHKGFTAIPWHNIYGRTVAIKYRSTKGKNFFYERNGTPISRLVYGLHQAKGSDVAVIVEGEIDALSWSSAGIPGIALGSASINKYKLELLRGSGIKKFILGGDNDSAGRLLNERLQKLLRTDFELGIVDYGEQKDANEVLMRYGIEGGLKVALDRMRDVPRINVSI